MSPSNIQTKSMQVLGVLYFNKNKKLSIEEINNGLLLTDILPSELPAILDGLRDNALITETFSVTDVLDVDSTAEITYQITSEGINRYNALFPQDVTSTFDEYNEDEKAKKKFNRKVLIGFAISVAVIISALVIYILSTG